MILQLDQLIKPTSEPKFCTYRPPSQSSRKSDSEAITKQAKVFEGKPCQVSVPHTTSSLNCVSELSNSRLSLHARREGDRSADKYYNEEPDVQRTATETTTYLLSPPEQEAEEEEEALHVSKILVEVDGDNPQLYVSLLRKCAEHKDLIEGCRVHDEIQRRGLLQKSLVIGNALVNLYAKCGLLAKAQQVCEDLPHRNEVSWNSLIAGYMQHGKAAEALSCYEGMQRNGFSPNAVTYACILKAIGSSNARDNGKEIHSQVVKEGHLEKHVVVGTALVDMYAKCGLLVEAQDIFNQLMCPNVVSCNALIAGYAHHQNGERAMDVYKQMQLEGISPSKVTYTCILKACGITKDTDQGKELHAEIAKKGLLQNDVPLANALIDMYSKCGHLAEAHMVLSKLPARDQVSYSALIAGYALHGYGKEALNCYEQMQQEGLSPDAVTFVCTLNACIAANDAEKCEAIHSQIVREGLEKDVLVGGVLVDTYARCGLLCKAQDIFDKLRARDVVAYSALIAGYVHGGSTKEAFDIFERMKVEGVAPNVLTYVCILRACTTVGAADVGEDIHKRFLKQEWLENNVILVTTLVDMYVKVGWLEKAQDAFNKLVVRDTVAWNALISGYAQHGLSEKCLCFFERMQADDVVPDESTFSCVLKACASMEAAAQGQKTHALMVKIDDMEREVTVGTALLDMYAKCGLLAECQVVFDRLKAPNVVSWNAFIGGYVQHGFDEEALEYFQQMQLEGISLSAVTYSIVLRACGSIGAALKGQEIHAARDFQSLLEEDVSLGIALADMYMKCGLLEKAQGVLDRLPFQNVVSWNMLIAGHAQLGETQCVIELFEKMLKEGIDPDVLTFTVLLNTCSHAGLLGKGQMYFEAMSTDYGFPPALEQHACMIDLLCRAGQLEKAVSLVKEMPLHANLTIWVTLLNAFQSWGDLKIGKLVFHYGAQAERRDAASYIAIGNFFAALQR